MSEQKPLTDQSQCQLSAREHGIVVIYGCGLLGVGVGCESAYQALVELAAAVKKCHNYPDYEPTGLFDDIVAQTHAKMENDKATALLSNLNPDAQKN